MQIDVLRRPAWCCDVCGRDNALEPIFSINHCGEDHAVRVHQSCLDGEIEKVLQAGGSDGKQ